MARSQEPFPITPESSNQSVQERQLVAEAQRLAKNQAANDAYIKKEYPNEVFISSTAQLRAVNEYTKNLTIPENVYIARSRTIIKSNEQRKTLEKELRQAGILTKLGNSIFLTPEPGKYKERVMDAVVNGIPYEFRNIIGKSRQIEQAFSDAKSKDKNANVFLNIDSVIGKAEAMRRLIMVLNRHPEYTGKIIVSFKGERTYFWDTDSLKQ